MENWNVLHDTRSEFLLNNFLVDSGRSLADSERFIKTELLKKDLIKTVNNINQLEEEKKILAEEKELLVTLYLRIHGLMFDRLEMNILSNEEWVVLLNTRKYYEDKMSIVQREINKIHIRCNNLIKEAEGIKKRLYIIGIQPMTKVMISFNNEYFKHIGNNLYQGYGILLQDFYLVIGDNNIKYYYRGEEGLREITEWDFLCKHPQQPQQPKGEKMTTVTLDSLPSVQKELKILETFYSVLLQINERYTTLEQNEIRTLTNHILEKITANKEAIQKYDLIQQYKASLNKFVKNIEQCLVDRYLNKEIKELLINGIQYYNAQINAINENIEISYSTEEELFVLNQIYSGLLEIIRTDEEKQLTLDYFIQKFAEDVRQKIYRINGSSLEEETRAPIEHNNVTSAHEQQYNNI